MERSAPPQIFSARRRLAVRERMARLQQQPDAARFLAREVGEDIEDRLSFVRHQPGNVLVLGDHEGMLADRFLSGGTSVANYLTPDFDLESPWPHGGFDFIAALFVLDTVNDLPGALIHMRNALAPGGLAIAAMAGAGSLSLLREIMLEADGDRPAPRLHPQVDVRSGGQLLQRAGFADPVVDTQGIKVRYRNLRTLVGDIRAQGLGNVLADPGPPLTRAAYHRAEAAFADRADADGRATETFEVLTLSGWRRS